MTLCFIYSSFSNSLKRWWCLFEVFLIFEESIYLLCSSSTNCFCSILYILYGCVFIVICFNIFLNFLWFHQLFMIFFSSMLFSSMSPYNCSFFLISFSGVNFFSFHNIVMRKDAWDNFYTLKFIAACLCSDVWPS